MTPTTVNTTAKTVLDVRRAPGRHWVDDGFPVHGMFGYDGAGVAERSPFLLLDYAAPTEANGNAKLLVLAGQPIHEPVVGYGPFVMNSREEIAQAIADFNSGRFASA